MNKQLSRASRAVDSLRAKFANPKTIVEGDAYIERAQVSPEATKYISERLDNCDSTLDPLALSLMLAQMRVKCNILWMPRTDETREMMIEPYIRMKYIIILFSFIVAPPTVLYATFVSNVVDELLEVNHPRGFTECIDILAVHAAIYLARLGKIAFNVAVDRLTYVNSGINDTNRIFSVDVLYEKAGITTHGHAAKLIGNSFLSLVRPSSQEILPLEFLSLIFNPSSANATLVKDTRLGVLLPLTMFTTTVLEFGEHSLVHSVRDIPLTRSQLNMIKTRGDRNTTYLSAIIEHMHEEGTRLEAITESEGFKFTRTQTLELPSVIDIMAKAKAEEQDLPEIDGSMVTRRATFDTGITRQVKDRVRIIVTNVDIPRPLHIEKINSARTHESAKGQQLSEIFLERLYERLGKERIMWKIQLGVNDHYNHYIRFKTDDIDPVDVDEADVKVTDYIITLDDRPMSQQFIVTFDPTTKTPIFNEVKSSFDNQLDFQTE